MADPREMVLAAEAALGEARRRGRLTPAGLRAVVGAVRDTPGPLARRARWALAKLAPDFPTARAAIAALAADPAWNLRLRAVDCVNSFSYYRQGADCGWAVQVVRTALADRHAQVRFHASVASLMLWAPELVPDLERALAAETNARVADHLREWALALLRDGYRLEEWDGDRCRLDVVTAAGRRVERVVGRREVLERGIQAVVAEIRSQAAAGAQG